MLRCAMTFFFVPVCEVNLQTSKNDTVDNQDYPTSHAAPRNRLQSDQINKNCKGRLNLIIKIPKAEVGCVGPYST